MLKKKFQSFSFLYEFSKIFLDDVNMRRRFDREKRSIRALRGFRREHSAFRICYIIGGNSRR